MAQVFLVCPKCRKKGFIEIAEENIKKSQRTLIAVEIDKKIICAHEMVAFLDRNLSVRDLIVVHTPSATLVCPKHKAQKVKQLTEALEKEKKLREYL